MFYVLLFFNLLNAYVIFDFMDRMYGRSYPQRQVYFFAYIIFVALHLFVNSFRIVPLNFCYEIFCICIFSYYLYKHNPKKYLYGFLFAMYLIFVDQGTFAIYSMIKSQSLFYSAENVIDMLMSGIMDFSMIFATYRFFIQVLKQHIIDKVSMQQNIFFVIAVLFEMVIIAYFTQTAESKIKSFEIVLSFFIVSFLLLDLYIVYLFKFVAKHNELKNQINLSDQQAIMLNRNIHDIENKYQQSRKVIHDVRNYLQILQELYQQGEAAEAAEYADQLHAKLNELEYRFQCDNRILAILINDQIMMAKAKGIDLRLQIENLNWSFMPEIDLTTLFGNLLNNAMEGCADVKRADKFIDVRIAAVQEHMAIRVMNSCHAAAVRQRGEQFITTKPGHAGIGISNIRGVVQKYDGNLKIETTAESFTVKIILPIG